MQLRRIHITNFKGIEDVEFKFDSRFNLIIGDNGVGKTSVLEAISVVLGAFLAGIDNVSSIHFSKDEIRREKVLIGQGSYNIKYKIPIKVECEAMIGEEPFSYIRQKKNINSARSTIEPRDICKKAADMVNQDDSILPIISYQSFSRVANQKKDKWENVFTDDFSRVVGYTDCLEEASNTKLLTNWCKRMEQISWQQDRKIAEYESVKMAIAKFMGIMLGHEECKVYYDKRMEELVYLDGSDILPVRLLSSGYRTLIGMVLDIAFRMAILNPNLLERIPERTNGIVLIDELELHLHPKWQWKVVEALKKTFPSVQFIATTHSPLLIASCQNENLIVLKDINPSADVFDVKADYMKTAKGWQINDVLETIMQTSNRDPETTDKLRRLKELAYKKMKKLINEKELVEYKNLMLEIRQLLPEGDIAIEEAALLSIEDILGE